MNLTNIAKKILNERQYRPMGKATLSINQSYPYSLSTDDFNVKQLPWGDVSYNGQEFIVRTAKGNAKYPWPKGKIGTLELSDSDFTMTEDTWGNNPSAAGGMSPGRAPTATTPPPAQSGNVVDISQSFRNFKLDLEKNEDAITKKFVEELKKQFLKKTVTANASKGSVGQIEKEYSINVSDVKIYFIKDKYYVVLVGSEPDSTESEYYLNDSQIQVNPATSSSTQQSGLRNVGGIVPMKPTPAGSPVAKNILPQG